MRSSIKYIFPAIMMLISGSCKKFLTALPVTEVSDQVTIVDASSAETAVREVYRTPGRRGTTAVAGAAVGTGVYYGGSFETFGYLPGDNVVWTGSQAVIQQFITHTITSDNGNLETVWTGIYATSNGANQVIAKVPLVKDAALSQTAQNQLTGEGYFIRALSYFDLARVPGGRSHHP